MKKGLKIHPEVNVAGKEVMASPGPRSYQDQASTQKRAENTISMTFTNRDALANRPDEIELFEMHVQRFHDQVVQITNTRLVEKLGSILPKQGKQEELKKFDVLYCSFIQNLHKITEIVTQIDFSVEQYNSNNKPIVDAFTKDIKSIEVSFTELVTQSSLRFMHLCTEINELDEYDIDLEFKIRDWYLKNKEMINKYNPKAMKSSKKGNGNQKKSICEAMCSCFPSNKPNQGNNQAKVDVKNARRKM